MGKRKKTNIIENTEVKRAKSPEEVITQAELRENALIQTFIDKNDKKYRQNAIIQAIQSDNVALFKKLLEAMHTLPDFNYSLLIKILGTSHNIEPVMQVAVSQKKWVFLDLLAECFIKAAEKTSNVDLSIASMHRYFLYVALKSKQPLATLQEIKSHYQIKINPTIHISPQCFDLVIQSIPDVEEGQDLDPVLTENFQFVWQSLDENQQDKYLKDNINDFEFWGKYSFLINQGIPCLNYLDKPGKLKYFELSDNIEEINKLIQEVITNDRDCLSEYFSSMGNVFEIDRRILNCLLEHCPDFVCKRDYDLPDNWIKEKEDIEVILKILKYTSKDRGFSYFGKVFIAIATLPDESTKKKEYLQELFANFSEFDLYARLHWFCLNNVRRNDQFKPYMIELLKLNPNLVAHRWRLLEQAIVENKIGSIDIATLEFLIGYEQETSVSKEAKSFLEKLSNLIAKKKKHQSASYQKKIHLEYLEGIENFFRNDFRFCNYVEQIKNKIKDKKQKANTQDSQKKVSEEERILTNFSAALRKRYGNLDASRAINDFLDNRLTANLQNTITENLNLLLAKAGFSNLSSEQNKSLIAPILADLKSVQRSAELYLYHPGKNLLWLEKIYIVCRAVRILSISERWSICHFWTASHDQQFFNKEQQQELEQQFLDILADHQRANNTPGELGPDKPSVSGNTTLIKLFKLLEGKHPDIVFPEKQVQLKIQDTTKIILSNSINFFKPLSTVTLKEKIEAVTKSWQSFRLFFKTEATTKSAAEQLKSQVATYGFRCHDVAADGNCFFHAVIHQLGESILTPDDLRAKAVDYVVNNPSRYERHVPGGLDNLLMDYTKINSTTWADHIIIDALAQAQQVNFVIINEKGTKTVIKGDGATKTLFLGHEADLHYQSLLHDPTLGVPLDVDALLNERSAMQLS